MANRPTTPIPMPQSPVVDLQTGRPTIEWYRFFAQPAFQSLSFGGTIGIANGGTGQTTTSAAFDALAPTTTPGDLIVRGPSTNSRLGIGPPGTVLTSFGGTAAWRTPNTGGPATTDQLAEGIVNLYFTKPRVAGSLVAGAGISLAVDGSGNTTIAESAAMLDNLTDQTGVLLTDQTGVQLTANEASSQFLTGAQVMARVSLGF